MSMSEPDQFTSPQPSSNVTCLILGLIGFGGLALLFVVVAAAVFFLRLEPARPGGAQPGQPGIQQKLPTVNLIPLTGDGPSIGAADLEGKVVLINLWASWCPPCKQEFPHIVEIGEDFADNDEFLLLSLPVSEDNIDALRTDTENFLEQRDVELLTYGDPTGTTVGGIMQLTGERGIPQTLLLDRTGILQETWIGYSSGTERKIRRAVEELLEE